jgi:hypothetical protein
MNTPTEFRLNIPRAVRLPGLQIVVRRARVRYFAHVTDRESHSLMELELIYCFVMSHIQERLPVHLQDLVADLKHTVTTDALAIMKMAVFWHVAPCSHSDEGDDIFP